MNPELLIEKVPQVGRIINVCALTAFVCEMGLAASSNENAALLFKTMHQAFMLIAVTMSTLDFGYLIELTSQRYPVAKERGFLNPVRIQNYMLSGGNFLLYQLTQNIK